MKTWYNISGLQEFGFSQSLHSVHCIYFSPSRSLENRMQQYTNVVSPFTFDPSLTSVFSDNYSYPSCFKDNLKIVNKSGQREKERLVLEAEMNLCLLMESPSIIKLASLSSVVILLRLTRCISSKLVASLLV